jgi:hypothetical protein
MAAIYLKEEDHCWYMTRKAELASFEIFKTKMREYFLPAK